MNPTASLVLDRVSLELADHLTATLTVDAPSIQMVTPPKLTADTAAHWHIRPIGSATVTKTADGERWVQAYRLDPYQTGDAVPLTFAPVRITTASGMQSLEIPAKAVAVRTNIREVSVGQARPLLGFETPPLSPSASQPWPLLLVGAVVLVASIWRWRRRRSTPSGIAADWLAELSNIRGPLFAERLADGVRHELIVRYRVPANCRTTPELAGIADPTAREILAWCDRVKFAREHPADKDCQAMLERTRFWRNADNLLSPAVVSG